MADIIPQTKVEFLGNAGSIHIIRKVRVNGSEVCVAEGGIDLKYSSQDPTTVTLTLLATEVHFRSEAKEPTVVNIDNQGLLGGIAEAMRNA